MPLKSSFSEASKGKGKLSIGLGSSMLTTLCKVNIVVQENTTPNNVHMVVIDGVTYKNGEAVTLEPGIYSLIWASGNGGIFSSWSTSGNISVEDESAEETELEVTCGGTLTLNLVACPSGEQITNGGFETGDFTGWENRFCVISTENPHAGSYCVRTGYQNWINQMLDTPITKACISSFSIWARLVEGTDPRLKITIYLKADGSEIVDTEITATESWAETDLLALIPDGKTVYGIWIFNFTDAMPTIDVDDVSLIGTG